MSISNYVPMVEFAFYLSRKNASIEQVFSIMNITWTDVRNQMDIKTGECCLITKIYCLSCMKFHDKIIKNHTFFNKIYNTKKKQGNDECKK